MKKIHTLLGLTLLGFGTFLSANIDTDIKNIENASTTKERVAAMNSFKQSLAEMNQEDRQKAISKFAKIKTSSFSNATKSMEQGENMRTNVKSKISGSFDNVKKGSVEMQGHMEHSFRDVPDRASQIENRMNDSFSHLNEHRAEMQGHIEGQMGGIEGQGQDGLNSQPERPSTPDISRH